MGYPMTYGRVVNRNGLTGDYGHDVNAERDANLRRIIAGDLRRLEKDQRDPQHLARYAKYAGVTPGQARKILDAFFHGDF